MALQEQLMKPGEIMSLVTSSPTKGEVATGVPDHTTSEIASPREIRHGTGEQGKSRQDCLTGQGSKLGIDATKKLPGEGFKRPWPRCRPAGATRC
jgi:hypothetical protein